MLLPVILACFAPVPPVLSYPQLEPLVATEVTRVEAPGAPAGCISSVQVRVANEPCAAELLDAHDGNEMPGGYTSQSGHLAGPDGRCSFMCLSGRGRHWLFWTLTPGWRGAATCTVEGLGSMTIDVIDYVPGGEVDPAVGALWLPAGAPSWGMERIPQPDGTTVLGVGKNGCPGGQPSRGPSPAP